MEFKHKKTGEVISLSRTRINFNPDGSTYLSDPSNTYKSLDTDYDVVEDGDSVSDKVVKVKKASTDGRGLR